VLAFANGGMHVAKPTKPVLVVLAALLLASLVTVLVLSMRGGGDGDGGGGGTTAATRSPVSSGAAPAGSSATATAPDARTPLHPVAEHRAAMLAAIARARAARGHPSTAPTGAPVTPTTTGSGSTATTLEIVDKTGDTSDWSKRALGTLNRLLGQCYDLGRAEDASLTGTVTVRFTLVAEPGVGGLLEPVEIVDADTTITQQTIRDCLTQQLYALELDPPPAGVTVEREVHLQVP
jgi:hypothetical protein